MLKKPKLLVVIFGVGSEHVYRFHGFGRSETRDYVESEIVGVVFWDLL